MQVYLDHNATTPVRPEVMEAMIPFMTTVFGNASSSHTPGQQARKGLEEARERFAAAIGASPEEIVFMSGGSEGDNMAIRGACSFACERGSHVITSAVEHPAVMDVCRDLESMGSQLTVLPVDGTGLVDSAQVGAAVLPETVLVTVMTANNEVGTIQPLHEIGAICRERGIPFHTDAVQALGKIPFEVDKSLVTMASFSAHKLGGPKGAGALYIRRGTRIPPFLIGGKQERGLRAGTANVAGAVGLAAAAELAVAELDQYRDRMLALRDRLESEVRGALSGVTLNGHETKRLPNTCNLSFEGAEGESVHLHLDIAGVAVSTGSACSSGSGDPSPVLTAMGLDRARAAASVRFSFGRTNTEEEVVFAASKVVEAVKRLRGIAGISTSSPPKS